MPQRRGTRGEVDMVNIAFEITPEANANKGIDDPLNSRNEN